MPHRFIALLALICSLVAPSVGIADTAEDEARVLYEQGQTHYAAAEYHRAAGYFLRAYQRLNSAAFLFNVAQAYRLAGVCDLSAKFYRDFLSQDPETPNRAVVERHVIAMDVCAATLGHTATGSGGEQRSGRHTAGWISTGVGIGLLVGAGVFAYDASRASNEVSKAIDRGGPWTEADQTNERRGRRSNVISLVTSGLGIGAVAVGVALLVTSERESPSAPSVSATADGAVVGWHWGF